MAITIGLDLDYYWNLTPKQFKKYVKVYQESEQKRIKEIDSQNYNLGVYISYAFNSPKRYPKKPFLSDIGKKKTKQKVMSEKDMQDFAKSFASKFNN